jgi:hypothetical protein
VSRDHPFRRSGAPGIGTTQVSKQRYDLDRPSEGQVSEIKRHRRLTHRDIGVSEDIEHLHIEIAIRDFPTGVLDRPSTRTRGGRSW